MDYGVYAFMNEECSMAKPSIGPLVINWLHMQDGRQQRDDICPQQQPREGSWGPWPGQGQRGREGQKHRQRSQWGSGQSRPILMADPLDSMHGQMCE